MYISIYLSSIYPLSPDVLLPTPPVHRAGGGVGLKATSDIGSTRVLGVIIRVRSPLLTYISIPPITQMIHFIGLLYSSPPLLSLPSCHYPLSPLLSEGVTGGRQAGRGVSRIREREYKVSL